MATNLDEIGSNYQRELTQLSYLDITEDGQAAINDPNRTITVSELRQYLSEPDSVSYGDFGGTTKISQKMSEFVSGQQMTTDADILNKLEEYGMGDLKVVAIRDNPETGLQAMCFEDEFGNRGFSFRGTDFNFEKGSFGGDIIQGDIGEWLTGDSPAAREAVEFFKEHKDENGQNHLYGHSLGGNMVSHVFAENHEDVEMAFTFAGLGIHTDDLSPEQLEAFNSEKFNCWIPEGDVIGMLKDFNAYSDRVFFCDVSDDYSRNPVSSHLAQSSDTGTENLKQISREDAEQLMDKMAGTYAFCTGAHSLLEDFKEKAKEAGQSISEYAGERMSELREMNYGAFASALLDSTKEWAGKAFEAAREFISNPRESIEKAIDNVGDYVQSHTSQMDKENIASHHQPENEMKAEKVHETASISQGATVGVSQQQSSPSINKDVTNNMPQNNVDSMAKIENVAQNIGGTAEQKVSQLSNTMSSIDQLFGGDGNTFVLNDMREGLGFAQQAADFAKDFSRGDFISMGKDVLDFGQQISNGGEGNILDDAMDLSFGRER